MAVLMVIGAALMPFIDVGTEPMERQGKTLAIGIDWPDVAAKVVEQNVTSPVEGLVSSVEGIESVSSNSYFGRSEIFVKLKPETDVASARYEISSLLRQTYSRMPEGVGYPSLSGSEVSAGSVFHNENKLLLTYLINADMQPERIKQYVEQNIAKPLERVVGVSKVEVTGTTGRYIEMKYKPEHLAVCGLSEQDIIDAIRNFIGRDEIIGQIRQESADGVTQNIALRLATAVFSKSLEQMPVANVDGKIFYLNDLVSFSYKDYDPDHYYRVNGMNTIYLNIYVPADSKVILLSDEVQKEMDMVKARLAKTLYVKLSHDEAKQQREELHTLVSQTLMALLLLLLFVWLTSRNLRYLAIIAIALTANLLIAPIVYWLMGIQLHIYSLAGISVSLGLIIDSTIVMADHYSYYHNRKAFMAILAALLTTIGSLIVIFFLPKSLQDNLYDFAWIVMINLSVSLLVAYFFVPSLVDAMGYSSHHTALRHGRAVVRWERFYAGYLHLTSHHRWAYYTLLVLAFGIPIYALPTHLGDDEDDYTQMDKAELKWYENLYNSTLGSDFFQMKIKDNLSMALGGSMRLFAQSLDENRNDDEDKEKVLHIQAQMPLGGKASQLNEKIKILEEYLKTFKEIKTFTTQIDGRGGDIEVKFKDEWKDTGFPYTLENKVIGKVITIGGADWSTYGISQRGFSNALNLQHRNDRIVVSGYNYAQLYRLAEYICDYMKDNSRVQDIIIETPGREMEEDEFYMRYQSENMAVTDQSAQDVHDALSGMLKKKYVGHYHDKALSSDIYLLPSSFDEFDLWHLGNATIVSGGTGTYVPALMSIEKQAAKGSVHRENQEYVLNVAFNILGSYTYETEYIKEVIAHFNKTLPIGYKCSSPSWSQQQEESNKYWLILLIVAIIFFLCTILFESFRDTIIIISIIPASLIGTSLTFYFTGAEFGIGGFASLVLLCGITVNSGIYILNQYHLTRQNVARRRKDSFKLYARAFDHKIIPVILTTLSTIVGLVPFFFDGKAEPFWFSFATGVIGGLVFSVVALVFVMPLFVRYEKKQG